MSRQCQIQSGKPVGQNYIPNTYMGLKTVWRKVIGLFLLHNMDKSIFLKSRIKIHNENMGGREPGHFNRTESLIWKHIKINK
jgi:hypothetical protein